MEKHEHMAWKLRISEVNDLALVIQLTPNYKETRAGRHHRFDGWNLDECKNRKGKDAGR